MKISQLGLKLAGTQDIYVASPENTGDPGSAHEFQSFFELVLQENMVSQLFEIVCKICSNSLNAIF